MKITIPKTIEQVVKQLNGLGALLTAKEWERAAIVYAHTDYRGAGGKLGSEEFARLGIRGLSSSDTVTRYRKAWADAIDDGQAVAADPGVQIELPERQFPAHPDAAGPMIERNMRAALKRDPEALEKVIDDDPEMLSTVAKQIAGNDALREAVIAEATQPEPPQREGPPVFLNEDGEVRVDMNQMLEQANRDAANAPLAALYRILSAAQILRSNWTPELIDELDVADRQRMDRDVEDVIQTLNKVLRLIEEKASVVA